MIGYSDLRIRKKERTSGPEQRTPILSLIEKLNIFMKVCDAVAFAHSVNVIHRDLKPENIMVGEFGEVLVMDWGLAKVLGTENITDERMSENIETVRKDVDEPSLTIDGDYIGTPAFMSPEQADGEIEQIDKHSDIFSLAGVLYNMLTLEYPYAGHSVHEVLMKASAHRLVTPRNRIKILKTELALPKELDAIMMKAMSADKQARYKNVKNLKRDIEVFLSNEKVAAYHDNVIEKLIKWSKRNPAKALSGSVSVFFVLILIIIVSVLDSQRTKAELEEKNEKEERIKVLIEKGDTEKALKEMKKVLGVKIKYQREKAAIEFVDLYDLAQREGKSQEQFILELGEDAVRKYIRVFEKILEMGKKFKEKYYIPEDFFYIAFLYGTGLKEYETGIKYYREAINLNPQDAKSHSNLGLLLADLKRYVEAEKEYKEAIRLNPKDAQAYLNRGVLYCYHLKDYRKAISDWKIFLELMPNNPQAARISKEIDRMKKQLLITKK